MSGGRGPRPVPALAVIPGGGGLGDGVDGGGGPPEGELPAGREAIVLRYGELFLKGRNRRDFLEAVGRGVRRAVADLGVALRPIHGRFLVEGAGHAPEALLRLRRVFGIASVSPVWLLGRDPAEWERFAAARARRAAARGARRFGLSVQRPDKTFPVRSREICIRLGDAVGSAVPSFEVDLGHPDWLLHLEVGRESVFAWEGVLPGAGGLPTGTGGRVLLLLSGGIDSPVAGHLMQKRGAVLDAVYFDAFPYTGPGARQKAIELATALAQPQGRLTLHLVPFAAVQERFRDGAPADYLVVLYRRAMIRIAERLARGCGAQALATGESLGQVASQTLENLSCIDAAAGLPVLRPLISFDKAETIALARRIGTYEVSIRPHADCCALFVAKHPVTRAVRGRVEALEAAVELGDAVEAAVAGVERIPLGEDLG